MTMRYYRKISLVCVFLATCQIGKAVIKSIYILFGNFYHQPKLEDQGTWAVITGATDEMGIVIAEILAVKSLNLILYGSSEEDLVELAEYLSFRYTIQVEYFTVDFAQPKHIYKDIETELNKYSIGVLINAASAGPYYPEYFVDVPLQSVPYKKCYNHATYSKIININILPVTHFCRIIIPGMIKRRQGIIINISSGISTVPSPMLTIFASSKAYVNKFTADLRSEYGKYGITILCLTPGLLTFGRKPGFWMSIIRPSPEKYFSHAFKNIGVREQSYGYLPHSIIFYLLHLLNYLSRSFTRFLMLTWALTVKDSVLSGRVKYN